MSREKQIEEMAKALTKYEKGLCDRLPKDKCLLTSAVHAQVSCDYCKIAEFLYNAGFRKQEWISVDERAPKKWQRGLCYYPEKDYGSKTDNFAFLMLLSK